MHPVIFIDIHTHKTDSEPGSVAIRNILSDFDDLPVGGCYSVGLHPWYLKEDQADQLPKGLINAAKDRHVLAIGECGLDTRCAPPLDLQRRVFLRQIELAMSVDKPLIIHCVRAFDEVLAMLRRSQVSVPVIFHGFCRSETLALKIIDDGHLLSFGRHLYKRTVAEVFRKLPPDRVFLETDDAEIPISDIYAIASEILGKDISTISVDIEHRFKQIFRPVTDLI